MPEAKAFRALRFTPKAGAMEDLVAPPYDVISSSDRSEFASRSPKNVVHLTLPEGPVETGLLGSRYERAAEVVEEWLGSGDIEVEPQPSMTVVQEVFADEGRELARTGVEVALRLAAYGEGDVYPHERTLSAPKADRLALMRATKMQPGPVFMLVPDEEGDVRSAIAAMCGREPDHDIAGPDEASRRAWIERDAGRLATLVRAMAGRPAIIADGHHRYETALAYRDEIAAAGRDPGEAAFVLAHVVPIGDAGLVVRPTHRAVRSKSRIGVEEFLARLGRDFTVREVSREEALAFARRAPEAGEAQAFVVALGHPARLYRAGLENTGTMAARASERAEAWRGLDVPCLHLLVLEDILGITPEEVASGGAVSYSHDAAGAILAAVECEDIFGFIMRPTRPEAVSAVARAGERMPQKSTYFYPKVASGFAMRLLG